MNDLAQRLLDVNEVGIFRLNCSVDELRAAAAQAGIALFEADLSAVHGKGEFLAAVALALKAPDWFGHNWDALADALGDLSWQSAAAYVLVLRNGGDTLGLNAEEFETVSAILADTVSFWKSKNMPFWIFFC